jgi:hypothetical protein
MQTVESMKQTDLPDSEQNAAIVNMLKKQRQDILFDPRFSAADTAKRLALNDQVLHTQTAANHEYYGGQIVQLAAQAHDAALTPSQRQQSADDLQAMVQDPNLAPVLSPALKAHAEQSLGQFHRAKAATEFHAVVADMAAGNVPIASYSDFVRDFGARGMISGDPGAVGTETQMAQAMAAGAKIQKERKQNQQMAADGYKAVQDGGVPSAEQAKAISAGQPFTVGGKPFNPMTPGHAEAMVASYRVNRVVDPTVKTAMEDLPFAGNADAAESVRKIYDGMRKVLRETVPAGQNIGIHATIQKQLGTDVADFGRLVSRTGDPLLAMKEWTNRSVSDSGSAGASTKDIAGRTNDAIDQWLNNPDTIGYLQSSLPGKWLYGKPTIAQQAMADMAGRGRSATTLGGFGGARYNRVEIEDGSIREEWNNHASGAVISNGGLAQSITGDRWRDAVETGQRMIADDLEIVDHPTKPGVGLLQRLGSETLTAKANGLDPTAVTRDDAWRYWGTIANSWRQINGGAAGPEVDPTTVRAESFRADDGTKMIRVTDRVGGTKSWYGGMTQGGQERVIFELPQDHPVMTLGRDLQYMAAQHIDQIIRPKPSPELEAMKPALSMAYAGYLAERALHFGEYAQVKTPGLNERFRKGLMFEELRAGTGSPSFFAHPEMLWTRMSNMPSAPTVAEWRSKLAAQSEAGRQARIRDQESLSISKFLTQGGELGAGMPMPRPDTRVAP